MTRGRTDGWARAAAAGAAAGLALALAACGAAGGARIPSPPADAAGETRRLAEALDADGPSADRYARLAQARLTAGEPAQALPYALRALAMAPRHEGALVVAARVARAQGDLDGALARYEEAAGVAAAVARRVDGEWAEALLARAEARLAAGEPDRALDDLDTLAGRLPDAAAGRRAARAALALEAADALARRGSAAGAARAVARARAAGAAADAVRFADGRALWLAGEDEAAARELGAWAGAGGPERWERVAAFYDGRGAAAPALAAWRRAVEGREEVPARTWERLADAAVAAGDGAEAARAVRRAAEASGDDPRARGRVLVAGAERLRAAGLAGDATALYEAATEGGPGLWPLVEAHGTYLGQVGDLAGLRALLARYEDAAPDRAEAAARGAELLVRAGARAEAVARLEAVIGRGDAAPAAWLALARTLDRRPQEAARRDEALRRYVEAAGRAPEALVEAGRAWLEAGDREAAVSAAREATTRAPASLDAALLLADAQQAAGRAAEEEAAIAQALRAARGPAAEARASLRLGQRLLRAGDPARARPWLEEAVKAEDAETRRGAHEALWRVHLALRPPDDRAAAEHMRRWLALAPPEERAAALDVLAEQTVGVASLTAVRIEVLEELARLRPGDDTLTWALGQLHLARRDWAAARAAWERHLAGLADPTEAALRAGRAFLEKGRPDEALAFLVRVDPARIDSPRLHRTLGELWAKRGDEARAEVHDRLFLEAAGRAEQRHELRLFGRQMLQRRRDALAAEAWQRLVDRDPDDREAALGLGTALLRLRGPEAARPWLDRYVEATPPTQRRQAFQKVGAVYEEAGRLADAARLYGLWLEEERPGWTSASFTRLADTYRRMGDRAGLDRAARQYVARARNPARAVTEASAALERAGMLTAARGLVQDALEARPTDRSLLQIALRQALEADDEDAAAGLVRRFVRLRADGAEAWAEAAEMMARSGRPRAALALLRAMEDEGAAGSEVLLARGRLELAVGEYDAAEQSFLAAVSRAVSTREVAEAAHQAYVAAGQEARLERFHARALALTPGRSESPLALGRLRLDAGDVAEARKAFARYLEGQERGHLEVARAWAAAGYLDEAVRHFVRAWEQPTPGDDPLPLGEVADVLVAAGRLADLEVLARLHVRKAPLALTGAEAVADAWARAGRLEEAVAWLDRADDVAARPRHDLARGELLIALGRDEEAAAALERYVDRRVEREEPERRFTGRTRPRAADDATAQAVERWVKADRLDGALAQLRRSAARYGDGATLALAEARILALRGEVGAARARLERLDGEGIGSGHVKAVQELVGALEARDRLREAADVLDRALAATDDPQIGLLRLQILGRLGRVAEAARVAERLAASGGDAMRADIGRVALGAGLTRLARRVLEEAVSLGPAGRVADALQGLEALDRLEGRKDPPAETARRLAASPPLAEDRLEAAIARAELHAARGEDARALEAAEQALVLDPTSRDLRRTAILAAARLGARDRLLRVVTREPTLERPAVDAWEEAVHWLEQAHHPREALAVLDLLLEVEGGHVGRHVEALRLALQAGDEARAREATRRALEASGDAPRVRLQVAAVWLDWLQPAAARALLDGLEAPGPGLDGLRARLAAGIAAQEGRAAEAIAAFQARAAAGPDPVLARVDAAEGLLAAGLDGAAAEALVGPVADGPDAPAEAVAAAARAAWAAGRPDGARRRLDAWLARFPTRVSEVGELLLAAVAAGDGAAVERLADAVATRMGAEARAVVAGLAAAALDAASEGLDAAARERLVSALERVVAQAAAVSPGGSSQLASATAGLREAEGDLDGALAAYRLALLREPLDPSHANNLAYALARQGRHLDRALALIREASARAGRPVTSFLDTEAWVLHGLGRSEEALALLERAVHLSGERELTAPDSLSEMLYHLAEVQAAVGRAEDARASWRDCARRDRAGLYGRRCAARLGDATLSPDPPATAR